jgi:DNA helicase-2/ATP-dependent DNA helicase PcrA
VQGDWMSQLNMSQRSAVTHPDGPLLIVAGAGTGKTLTLAGRVAHLIERGARPERLLLLTFTRRAAREMLSRASRLTGSGTARKVWGGTFHAVGNRLLRVYGRALGIRPDFTVMDQGDTADLMNLIRDDLGLSQKDRRVPRKDTLAAIYSRTVNAGARLADVLDASFPWCRDEIEGIRSIFHRYTARKQEHNVLDYDDLLLYWHALAEAPTTRSRLAAQFDHVLVDEYQDTNALQADILWRLWGPLGNVTVVGDDAQAIYGFRSATVANILDFPLRFEGAGVLRLEQNYRSTRPILEVSNAVIAKAGRRHEKTLWSERPGNARPTLVTCLDEAEQSEVVCRSVLAHRERGVLLRRQAVLFRAAHHSDLLEVELSRRNIPFVKYGGLKFLEAAHVKDTLALLRILENPADEVSWFRVLQLLDGVGPAGARRLLRELGIHRSGPVPNRSTPADASDTPDSPIRRLIEEPPLAAEGVRDQLVSLGRALAECSGQDLPTAAQIERLRRFLAPVFERIYASPRERLRDLEQLEHLASRSPSRGRFITDLTLDPPTSTGDLAGPPLLDEDYLILSTIHSAKGLEWDVVHVIHAADGMIPSDMATGSAEEIEEERRLLYVAMTRARDVLHVSFPLRYYRRPRGLEDGHTYAQVSRFLTPEVRSRFDESVAPGVEAMGSETDLAEAEDDSASGSGRARVEGFLAGLWEG